VFDADRSTELKTAAPARGPPLSRGRSTRSVAVAATATAAAATTEAATATAAAAEATTATTAAATTTVAATATTAAAEAATAATTAAATRAAITLRAILGHVDAHVAAVDRLVVHRRRRLGVRCGREGDEAEAARATRLAIHHDAGLGDLTEVLEGRAQRVIGCAPGETAHKKFVRHHTLLLPGPIATGPYTTT
jgi:hypothetical protein